MAALATILSKSFNVADKLLPDAAFSAQDAAGLIRAAKVSPSPDAVEGLEQLLASIRAESELSLFGRVSLKWDFIRLLRNAKLVEDAHAANPALGVAPIKAPLIILGLPRSGTSFLHTLMAEDPGNQVPRNWQMIYPAPRPAGFNPNGDKLVRHVKAFA